MVRWWPTNGLLYANNGVAEFSLGWVLHNVNLVKAVNVQVEALRFWDESVLTPVNAVSLAILLLSLPKLKINANIIWMGSQVTSMHEWFTIQCGKASAKLCGISHGCYLHSYGVNNNSGTNCYWYSVVRQERSYAVCHLDDVSIPMAWATTWAQIVVPLLSARLQHVYLTIRTVILHTTAYPPFPCMAGVPLKHRFLHMIHVLNVKIVMIYSRWAQDWVVTSFQLVCHSQRDTAIREA